MKIKQKAPQRLLSLLLTFVMLLTAIPLSAITASAALASDIPEEMLDNAILRALEYTGYDVQRQKDRGTLYQSGHYGSRLAANDPSVLSDISYGLALSGKDTVADSSTVTGRAPDIAKFEQYGLCCASFVTYFICNYMPNIEGADTGFITEAIDATGTNPQSASTWKRALDKLAEQGKIEKVGTSTSNVDYSRLEPGDIIIFGNASTPTAHIAAYAGTYKGTHFIIHVGNDRGPEISSIEGMGHSSNGDKASYPNGFYHLGNDIFQQRGSIEVYKKDNKGTPLPGAVFLATDTKNPSRTYRIGPTNSEGYAKSEDPIPFSTYQIEEIVFPANYQSDGTTSWTRTLDRNTPNATITINAVNVPIPGTCKIVKHSEDGQIGDVPFQISGNGITQTVRTQADGTFLLEVQPGIYEVTELTENKYEPQATKRVTVVSGQTAVITFDNKLKRGDLIVTKTAEDGFVEDKTFRLSGTSLSGLPVDEYATTDSSGVARFSDVLISGNTPYTLEEIGVEDKYVIPEPQQATVEWNKVTHKSFDNILKKWRTTITKSDDETGTPQGDATLENAKYGVFQGTQLIDTYLTGPRGEFTTKWYTCGDNWTVRELEPSTGYLLNPETYHVGAEAKEYEMEYNELALDVGEQIVKGRVALIKHTDDGSTGIDTPEAGAEFEFFRRAAGSYAAAKESERDILTCDEYGFAESKDVPFGWYRLRQTKGWPGREMIDDIDIYISENGKVYRYLLNNANFESRVMLVKLDKETGNTVPLAGHGYKLFDPQGKQITMTLTYPEVVEIDTFYTDSNGCLITPEPLPYGQGYSAVEVQAVEPYVLDPTPVYFDILPESAEEVDGVTVIRVEKENMPQKGTISIHKDGEVFSSVATTGGSDGAPLLYQPVYAAAGLAEGVYDIVATKDVYSGGVLRYSAGQTVATLITGPDGSATSEPLYLSTFKIYERKAPYGMTLNPDPVTVTLSYAGQNVELTTTEVHITNERQRTEIRLQKALEQDGIFGLGMNGEIRNVVWGLYAREAMTAADGSVIPADGLLELACCDETGQIVFSTDLPVDSKVYAKEYSTDGHYLLSDKEYDLEFSYQGQDTPVVYLSANDGQPIENKLIRGDVTGYKVDDDGAPVDGAWIGLFTPDETEFTKANALMTCESMEGGKFGFYGVAAGDWQIREIAPAEGFVLSEEIFPVTITENEQVIEITIENRWIVGSAETLKLDAEYPENTLADAVFGIYADINGNQEYDEGVDRFIGNMGELDGGLHRMEGLRFGGYFCHEEVSPTGFLKDDNYYYFAINEDGETVRIENEAGVGFLNTPIYGELEITKIDSADHAPLPNVGFRIRDSLGMTVAEGCTDENGVARFRLRAGKYTYQEFKADGYQVDSTEFPFEITEDGQIIQATVTNEKIPTPEVPQTGDNTRLWPFIVLAGVSAGLIAVTVLLRKKKKENA